MNPSAKRAAGTQAPEGGALQVVLLAVTLAAGTYRNKTREVITVWDVLGLTSATLSVTLNFVVKNAMCTMGIG